MYLFPIHAYNFTFQLTSYWEFLLPPVKCIVISEAMSHCLVPEFHRLFHRLYWFQASCLFHHGAIDIVFKACFFVDSLMS